MKFEILPHQALLALCLTFVMVEQLPALPPPPPHDLATVQLATIQILDVNPKAPTVGQTVTVTYQVTNLGFENKPLSGNVTGLFQGKSLLGPDGSAPAVSLQPNESKTGQLTLATTDAGEGSITVIFREPLARCLAGKVGGFSDLCKPAIYATTSVQLIVVQPLVQVRIAGQRYAKISRPDSRMDRLSTTDTNVLSTTRVADGGETTVLTGISAKMFCQPRLSWQSLRNLFNTGPLV